MAIKFKFLQAWCTIFFCLFLLIYTTFVLSAFAANPKTIIISAEGVADPKADAYQRDMGLLIDALREDAKRQAIEKAVGIFVESSTLVENNVLIRDKVITRTKGLIKRVIKESAPWLGKNGSMHMLIKAEVYLSNVKDTLNTISREEQIELIKDYGNPWISISVIVRDAKRGSNTVPERSEVAENILKKVLKDFGYRVRSEKPDFFIKGEAKIKWKPIDLSPDGPIIPKYDLTSWTVKCTDKHTGEEVYFNNKVPRGRGWSDEDAALEDIGRLIGHEFTREFFEEHLMRPTRIFQLQVFGLPDYDIGILLKKEFIGLRPIINVDFRNFDAGGPSEYEVEFSGSRENFCQILNGAIIKPLNNKFKEKVFKISSTKGEKLKVNFHTEHNIKDLLARYTTIPPESLSNELAQKGKAMVNSPVDAAREF